MTDPVIKKLAGDLTKAQKERHSIEGVIFVFYLKLLLGMAAFFAVVLLLFTFAISLFKSLIG